MLLNILYRWHIMEIGHNIQHNINLCEGHSIDDNIWHPDQIVYDVQHVCAKACPKIIQNHTSNSKKTELS